eukprot:CAMPEP_0116882574 /NCGR_PEP_ID=MMETSP0463-20121206/14856_1 /TAXON_ID=181622 /ORGANISM="Strombidinopsis sp, Strain SopsisLIS2011" /LENGTH=36 /DNA_ID= /DNA_START= /DNA_END= /DNA_ORIENTATION=
MLDKLKDDKIHLENYSCGDEMIEGVVRRMPAWKKSE